ncbi:MAG: hypothetical protein ACOYO1_02975 [Bacteroidales bacterium]
MKKISILALLILCIMNGYSQKDTIRYNVLYDDPYAIRKLSIEINPMQFNFDATNYMALRAGIGLSYQLTDMFDIKGRFSSDYPVSFFKASNWFGGDVYTHPTDDNAKPEVTNNKYTAYEFGVGIKFSDNVRKQKIAYGLHSTQTGNIIINNVIIVEAKTRRVRRLRAGIIGVNQMVKFKGVSMAIGNFNIYTKDGVEFNQNGVIFPDVNYLTLKDHEGATYLNTDNYSKDDGYVLNSTYKANMFYIGYSSERIFNQVLDIDNYGKRTSTGIFNFYVDLIIGKPEYGSIQYFASDPTAVIYGKEIGTQLKSYDIDFAKSGYTLSSMGFRIGIEGNNPSISKQVKWEDKAKETNRLGYWGYRVNLGVYPAYTIWQGAFAEMSIFYNINPF